MTEQTPIDAVRMQRRARRMKWVNVPMRLILGLPFPTPLSGQLMLLRLTGRKTGRIYRQPVSYVRDGDTLLTPGGGKWTGNLRASEAVTIRLRGRLVPAWPERVRAAEEVERLLGRMLAANSRLTSFVPFIDHDGTVDSKMMQLALEHGFCIVRWHLTEPR